MIIFYFPRYHVKFAARLFSTSGNGPIKEENSSKEITNQIKYLKDFKHENPNLK
jgi:hypothetical protein